MKILEIKDKKKWEDFLLACKEKSFLDSWNWGEFNKIMGNKIWRLGIFEENKLVGIALVIKIKARRGTFLFVPHGPVLPCNTGNPKSQIPNLKQIPNPKSKILKILLKDLKEIAKEEKCSFVRIAPIWDRTRENVKIFKDLGFRNAPIHMHPELSWEIDITRAEQDLLMDMRKTTRYLIRQAQKNKDIEILQNQKLEDVVKFNKLYQETVDRHHFTPFSLAFLRNEFLAFQQNNQILVFLGKYKNEIVASAMIIFWQDMAFYHQGASSRKYPKIPVSYFLQWKAIKEAKKRGCHTYNFWGIAPVFTSAKTGNSKSQIPNRKHPWYGLTLFKMGFGGYKREYVKTQDLVLSPRYWLNYIVERIRKYKRAL